MAVLSKESTGSPSATSLPSGAIHLIWIGQLGIDGVRSSSLLTARSSPVNVKRSAALPSRAGTPETSFASSVRAGEQAAVVAASRAKVRATPSRAAHRAPGIVDILGIFGGSTKRIVWGSQAARNTSRPPPRCGIIPPADDIARNPGFGRAESRNAATGRSGVCVFHGQGGVSTMKRRTKWILGAGVILLVGGGAAARLGNKDRDLPRVTTGKVAKKDLVSRVTCNGKVQARKKVELSAPIAGQIINLAVREGDSLKKGDFLMQIDRVTLQANADSSKAALAALLSDRDAAKANLERDRLEYERASTSYRGGVIAELDFQRAKAAYDASQANLQSVENRIEQARATFAGARDTLSKTTIMAPIAGLITRLNVEEGEVAIIGTMNNPGTVLMTISDLSVIEAVMDVDETDIPQVIVGQKATLLIDAYPGKAF